MKFHNATKDTKSILAFDFFMMLGLQDLDDERKDEFLQKVAQLTMEYYMQEKVGENLTRAQMEEIINKYPLDGGANDEKNVDAILEEIGLILPNAAQLFIEAQIETKAKLVTDHYKKKSEQISNLLNEETDQQKRQALQDMLDHSNRNLNFAQTDRWDMIQWSEENVE